MVNVVFVAVNESDVDLITKQLSKKERHGDIIKVVSQRNFSEEAYKNHIIIRDVFPNKENALLVDMTGNLFELGALGSPMFEKSKKESKPSSHRICPDCEEVVFPVTAKDCPCCGYVFPEQEKPKVAHSYSANTTGNAIFEEKVTYDVYDVTYKEHINKKKGTRSIRVDYFCDYGKYGTISEWLAAWSTSAWARDKSAQFFEKRGYRLGSPIETYSADDLLFHAQKLKQPAQIVVDHSEEFPRIVEYIWEKPEQEKPLGDFLDDEIIY
jgi:ribosomal protein L37E